MAYIIYILLSAPIFTLVVWFGLVIRQRCAKNRTFIISIKSHLALPIIVIIYLTVSSSKRTILYILTQTYDNIDTCSIFFGNGWWTVYYNNLHKLVKLILYQ